MVLPSDAFAAALRQLASSVTPGQVPAALAEAVAQARAAVGARGAWLHPFEGDALACTDGAPVDLANSLAARVQRSGAPEAEGDAVAVPVEGLFGTWGVLVVEGGAEGPAADAPEDDGLNGATSADALVRLLRVAAVAGRLVAHHQSDDIFAEQQARARAILETTVDGIVTIGVDGRMHAFNQAAERLFQRTAAEAIGQNVSILMPEPDRSRHDGYIQRYLQTGEARIIGIGREVVGARASGETFPMDLSVSEVLVEGHERLFTGIVRDVSDRRALEQEVLRVSDEERRRIGQDLHDGLGQMLSGIALITSGLARRLVRSAPETAPEVEEIAGLVREADSYARTLARSLVPVELAQGGLVGALERLADSARRLFGFDVALNVTEALPDLGDEAALHLYRIAQEAVSNAVRHGGAQAVTIALTDDGVATHLAVTDDGRGFGAEVADRAGRGLGLRIMHHRARLIGAALTLDSRPGEGTTVRVVRRHAGDTPARSLDEQLRALPRS